MVMPTCYSAEPAKAIRGQPGVQPRIPGGHSRLVAAWPLKSRETPMQAVARTSESQVTGPKGEPMPSQSAARSVVLALAGLVLGAALSTGPAVGHLSTSSHVWKKHVKPKLKKDDTINQSNNPVNWTKLKEVPSGIADGVDDERPNAYSTYEKVGPTVSTETVIAPLDLSAGDYLVTGTAVIAKDSGDSLIATCWIEAHGEDLAETRAINTETAATFQVPITISATTRLEQPETLEFLCLSTGDEFDTRFISLSAVEVDL